MAKLERSAMGEHDAKEKQKMAQAGSAAELARQSLAKQAQKLKKKQAQQ